VCAGLPAIFAPPSPCHSPSPTPSNTVECCLRHQTPLPLPPLNTVSIVMPQSNTNGQLRPSPPCQTLTPAVTTRHAGVSIAIFASNHPTPLVSIAIFASTSPICSPSLPPLNADAAIERPPHRRHCTPSSSSTAATAATAAAATCVVDRFTLVH
jgi:hypothetical protein